MILPPVAHFIWYGRALPWAHALAIRSAHDRGSLDRRAVGAMDLATG